jgi:hypothetical protein
MVVDLIARSGREQRREIDAGEEGVDGVGDGGQAQDRLGVAEDEAPVGREQGGEAPDLGLRYTP